MIVIETKNSGHVLFFSFIGCGLDQIPLSWKNIGYAIIVQGFQESLLSVHYMLLNVRRDSFLGI